MKNNKVVIGLHSLIPRAVFTLPNNKPSVKLNKYVKKITHLTTVTDLEEIPAFLVATNVLALWSTNNKTEQAARKAIWDTGGIESLEHRIVVLNNSILNDIVFFRAFNPLLFNNNESFQ